MCGICGFVSRREISTEQLTAMNDTMAHRGPDDSGVEIFAISEGYAVGLAHRRLAIQDISALGHQPMYSADDHVGIVFNGEIYNFHDLRRQLCEYPFVSNTDTEVILAAYQKWGIQCIDRFNGMFAIALFDREEETLYLARDRLGKKPLYYNLSPDGIVFASELKPLMKMPGFSKTIRSEVLSRYLYKQYICSPDSIFEDVYKVEPGMLVTFKKGKLHTQKYWNVADVYKKCQRDPVNDYEQAKTELENLLVKAVQRRMIADVPLGAFLSGGYDSSLVVSLMQEQSIKPIQTFSIGFDEPEYNEAPYAKAVAEYLGTDHTELYITEADMCRLLDDTSYFFDEPFADSSLIPTMIVSKLARENVTVALSGDGGDELFCGYTKYDDIALAQKLDPIGKALYPLVHFAPFEKAGMPEHLPFKVRTIIENRAVDTKTQFGNNLYTSVARKMLLNGDEQLPCNYMIEEQYGVENWQIRSMLLDIDTYLPDQIVTKLDRAAMRYALETRCPILDKDVVEYSFRMAHDFKYHASDKKHILKDLAYTHIPKQLLDRPKRGFTVPIDKWLRGPLKEQIMYYGSRKYLTAQDLFDADYTSNLVSNYLENGDIKVGNKMSRIIWPFYMFQKWYEFYINGNF